VGFHKIAEIIGAEYLLIVCGILLGIITLETILIGELIYRVGGIRNLFFYTANIFNQRSHDTSNK
jgi:hypothetical protein